ncbi:MAG TPA: hypothetical protein VEY71_08700, partial [Chitinophagales bacterium]|nr:hypothetical protein [Chitinophagales bacterium]
MTKYFFFLSLGLLAANASVAQPGRTDIKSDTIYVIKDYRPQLADAVKYRTDAGMPAHDTSKYKPTYNVDPTLMNLPYKPATLRPVAMSRENEADTLLNSYIKAGFGTQWSPLFDAHIANGPNDKLYYAINAFHHSADGAQKFKNFADNRLAATVKFPRKKVAVGLQGGYESNAVYYYAYDLFDSILNEVQNAGLKQRYINAGGGLVVENSTPNKMGVNYKFHVTDYLFFSSRTLSENTFGIGGGFNKSFLKEHTVGVDVGVEYISAAFADSTATFFLVPIHPYYEFRKDIYLLRGGFTVVPADDATGVLFYPDVYAQVNLMDGQLLPFFQAGGQTVKYLGQGLSRINPWTNEAAPKVIGKTIDVQGGVKGSFASRWAYAARLGFRLHDYLPIFRATVNTPVTQFNVDYAEDVQELNPHAEIGYRFSDKIAVTLQGDYFKYTLDFGDPAYGYPDWKVTLGGHYNIGDKIILKADMFGHPATEQLLDLPVDSVVSVNGWF